MLSKLFGRTPRSAAPLQRIEPPPPVRPPVLQPGDAFTPTQPRQGRREIAGRQEELQRILQALQEERAHVVLYTERGRGKTTLANLVISTLRQKGVIVARHTCEAGSSFDSVMRGLARDLPRSLLATHDAGNGVGCEGALPPGELRPRDVVALMSKLLCRSLVCVVDEFDRIEDPGTRTRLADTIKQVSDGGVPLLFMVVGVSENLEQILGQHPSIQRNLVAVQLPLLRDADVVMILEQGAEDAGFTLFPGAAVRAAAIARGSPYMAQLLGLRLVQAAARRGDKMVLPADLTAAAERLVEDVPQRTASLYASLTSGGADGEMVRALRALATAEQDTWGRVRVMPSFRDGVAVGQAHIKAERWARILDSGAVQPTAGGYGLYAFPERSFLHHILLLDSLAPDGGRDMPAALHVIALDQ